MPAGKLAPTSVYPNPFVTGFGLVPHCSKPVGLRLPDGLPLEAAVPATRAITTAAAVPPSFRYELRERISCPPSFRGPSRCGAGVIHPASNTRALRQAEENPAVDDRPTGDRAAGGTIRAEAGTREALPPPRASPLRRRQW